MATMPVNDYAGIWSRIGNEGRSIERDQHPGNDQDRSIEHGTGTGNDHGQRIEHDTGNSTNTDTADDHAASWRRPVG
jgi:hypothetical protein